MSKDGVKATIRPRKNIFICVARFAPCRERVRVEIASRLLSGDPKIRACLWFMITIQRD
jgi:hypothetical protein